MLGKWDHVYVTSNVHPDEWYTGANAPPALVREAIMRRLDRIVHVYEGVELEPLEAVPEPVGGAGVGAGGFVEGESDAEADTGSQTPPAARRRIGRMGTTAENTLYCPEAQVEFSPEEVEHTQDEQYTASCDSGGSTI